MNNYKRHLSDLIPADAHDQEVCSEAEGRDKISLPITIDLRRWGKPFSPLNFQKKIIDGIKGLIDYGPVKGLLALPTGSGKMLTTCRLVLESLCHSSAKNKNVIWLAPQRELLYQASEAFQAGEEREDFFAGYSIPRNKTLMRVFKDLNMVEYLGSGMPRILKAYPKGAYTFSSRFIRTVFLISKESLNLEKQVIAQPGNGLKETFQRESGVESGVELGVEPPWP